MSEKLATPTPDVESPKPGEAVPPKLDNAAMRFINGPVLSTADWFTQGLRTPPSYHSALCASAFAVGSFAGVTSMAALTGVDLIGITRSAVNPAYNKERFSRAFPNYFTDLIKNPPLKYNPHSLAYKDQWMRVAHYAIPLVIGAACTYLMSEWYFAGRNEKLSKAEYLDDYDLSAGALQAKPWRVASGITTIPKSLSGLPFIPFFPDYASAMSANYSLNASRGVITPGLNSLLSGKNSHRFTQNGALLLRYLAAYGAFNPAKELKEGPEIVHEILHHFYGENETREHEQKFLELVTQLRDELRSIHKDPKEMQRILESRLTGQGFENLLREVGLDPKAAKIGNNGLLGSIGDFGIAMARTLLPKDINRYFGFDETVSELNNERVKKLLAREAGTRAAPIRIMNPGIDPLDMEQGESHLEGVALTNPLQRTLPYQLYGKKPVDPSTVISEQSRSDGPAKFTERDDIKVLKDRKNIPSDAPLKTHADKAQESKVDAAGSPVL